MSNLKGSLVSDRPVPQWSLVAKAAIKTMQTNALFDSSLKTMEVTAMFCGRIAAFTHDVFIEGMINEYVFDRVNATVIVKHGDMVVAFSVYEGKIDARYVIA